METPEAEVPATDAAVAHRARLSGLAALAAEETAELARLSPEEGIRILETLLAAGFDMIDDMVSDAARAGGDADRLSAFLLGDAD